MNASGNRARRTGARAVKTAPEGPMATKPAFAGFQSVAPIYPRYRRASPTHGISRRASACGLLRQPQTLPSACYPHHTLSNITPSQDAIVGAGDAAQRGDVGGGQQRVFGQRITEQPVAGCQHDLGVGPADHPVGMLDLDGMMEGVAEDIERLAP